MDGFGVMPILVHCSLNNHLNSLPLSSPTSFGHEYLASKQQTNAFLRFVALRCCAALWLVQLQTSLLPDGSFSWLYSWCNFLGIMIEYCLMKSTFTCKHGWVSTFFVVKCQYFFCFMLNTWQQWYALQHFSIPVLSIQALWIEVAISISTCYIVHINGPFLCGEWSDLRIARNWLHSKLESQEYYLADAAYRCSTAPTITRNGLPRHRHPKFDHLMARHETINRRFKEFAILREKYLQKEAKHDLIFRCIVVLIQIEIMSGHNILVVP